MTMKQKLLLLCLLVMVIVAFAVFHVAGHLAFVVEHLLVVILAALGF